MTITVNDDNDDICWYSHSLLFHWRLLTVNDDIDDDDVDDDHWKAVVLFDDDDIDVRIVLCMMKPYDGH